MPCDLLGLTCGFRVVQHPVGEVVAHDALRVGVGLWDAATWLGVAKYLTSAGEGLLDWKNVSLHDDGEVGDGETLGRVAGSEAFDRIGRSGCCHYGQSVKPVPRWESLMR